MARGTVVITGTSTGIGRATALRLARAGFDVLAGVRRDSDGAALHEADGRIEPVIVDVTDADQVAALARRIAGGPLAGLVNNAGIAVAGPLEGVPLAEMRRQYEVNVFGLLAVTQALLEPLRAGRGRIVNIGSIGGRINTPFVGPYSSSKAAVRSLSASLRRELRPWKIEVALVEPGALDTPIWRKGEEEAEDTIGALPERVRTLYAQQLDAMVKTVRKIAAGATPPEAAAEAVEHALTARRPRTLYTVGREARIQGTLHALLPDRAFDALVERALR
ncbi:MAG TPA: SDR family NAD(P)-dependent oxidoreductase [Solirubrobacteraceae bacterium]|jgi:NAD(P)-dependent dehydrogenase (short-subunit alcohol dehydrogenase family)